MRKFTILSLLMLCISGVFAAQDIYISTTGDDSNAGTQESPYATLAKATSMVSEDGAVIHVASGTYIFSSTAVIKPYNQTITGDDAANTVFDGNNAVALIDGLTEMQLSEKTLTISKLAFKNGKFEVNAVTGQTGGAAIKIGMKSNLSIDNCSFSNNLTESTTGVITWGGAIYFCGNNLTVDNCFFEQNTCLSTAAEAYGGAIVVRHSYNPENLITNPHVVGGPTYAVIKNSTFYKNSCKSKGGAIYFNKQLDNGAIDDDDATFVVQNSVFLENTSNKGIQLGGAITLSSGANNATNKMQSIILTNNTMCNNSILNTSGDPTHKNTVLLEGFRYTSYMANNLITSSISANGEGLYANQPAPIEYGMNNIIDKIGANINGTDFTTNAAAMNNLVVAVNPDALNLSTTLSGYPIGSTFKVPYLSVSSGSPAINGGVNSYEVNTIANPAPASPVEYVLQTDIQGTSIYGASKDLGAFEFTPSSDVKNGINDKYIIINEESGIRLMNINKNERVLVYNTNGSLIFNEILNDDLSFIPLSEKGLYIITVNGKAMKYQFR
ncbi:MAG: hypothetical protein VB046_09870 [Paludibacter sp.]|nr:hypothetical protein [Paludibacter sp.]